MWLSNLDFLQLFTKACTEPFPTRRCVTDPACAWDIFEHPATLPVCSTQIVSVPPHSDSGHRVINGMSSNTGMRWDISETKAALGYEPVSDSWDDAPHYHAHE